MSVYTKGWTDKQGKYRRIYLYGVWLTLKSRCLSTTDKDYRYYGERGVGICLSWLRFDTFRAWSVENGYRRGLTIDRRDNYKGYEPDNCRWVTQAEQNRNKRSYNNGSRKLSDGDILAIRKSNDKPINLANQYGITRNYVYNIKNYVVWKNLR